jgi:hypothetical protein
MTLSEIIAAKTVFYFADLGMGNSVARNPRNPVLVHFMDFNFTYDVSGQNLKLFIDLPQGQESKLQRHLLWIEQGDWMNDPGLGKTRHSIKKGERRLGNRKYEFDEQGHYSFSATLLTKSPEIAANSISNYVIRPLGYFVRKIDA